MQAIELSDFQWGVLDLLMRAREKGIHQLHRAEILFSKSIPQIAAAQLTMAALTIPESLVVWVDQHNFKITEQGVSAYNLRFDNTEPSAICDSIICLPDRR